MEAAQRDSLILQMRGTYGLTRFLERSAQEVAFMSLREEVAYLPRDDRNELRAGIGLAALQGTAEGEPDVLLEFVFGPEDKARLDAMRLLYEFFDREEVGRKPRRRSFSLAEMKELVKKVDDWLFRRKDPPAIELVAAKNCLASFLLAVAGEGIVEEVTEAEGIMPTANFLGEMDATMLRQATPQELGQKLRNADAALAALWQDFSCASFSEGDAIVQRLLFQKHEAELLETELLFADFGEPGPRGLEETRGHVLLSLAASSREDADLISDESQDEAARYRKSATNKLEQIRKLAIEPAKDAREATEKELRIAKLRRQRERALAYAQEAAGREAALQKLANLQENKAGAIFDRLEGE